MGYRGTQNHTKSSTIVLAKSIVEQPQEGKEHKRGMKVLKQNLGSTDIYTSTYWSEKAIIARQTGTPRQMHIQACSLTGTVTHLQCPLAYTQAHYWHIHHHSLLSLLSGDGRITDCTVRH